MNIAAYAIVFLLTLTRYKALTLSVRKDTIKDNFMLVGDSSSKNIYQLNLKDQRVQEIKAKGDVVMYDPVQERVIWTSFEDTLLFSMHLNGTGKKQFPVSDPIEYFDVDYSTGNIYYTALDRKLRHYYISVLSPDGKHIDLHNGLGISNGLVVYPSEGYIFYLENHALLRITMDGKQSENLFGYLDIRGGLTVDYKNGYLYWLEDSDPYRSDTTVVKYCKPDGTDHNTLTSIRLDEDGHNYLIAELAVYEDDFFISSYKPSRLMKLNKSKPSEVTELIVDGELGIIGDISIYSSKTQNKNAFCSDQNGLCSTFCLPVPGGGVCACEDGVDFQEGSTSVCSNKTIKDNFMLVGDSSSKKIYELNLKDQRVQETKAEGDVVMYDPVQERVIWTTFKDNLLFSMHLNGTGKKQFPVSDPIEYFDVDYSTGNIYYTALDRKLRHYYISVLSPDGKHIDLHNGLGISNGLVVYPSEGYIFYLENHALLRITMDGKQSENLLGYLDIRGGLTVDYKNGYLYWLEDSDPYRSDTTVVKYCKPDGTDHNTLTSIRLDEDGHNYLIAELAVYEDDFFISSYKPSRLMKLNKSKPSEVTELIVEGGLGIISDISIYSSKSQNKNAFCSDHNGRCSTFCLPIPGSGVCACEDGVDFKEGSTSVCSNMMDGL